MPQPFLPQLRKPLTDEGFAIPPPENTPRVDTTAFKPAAKDDNTASLDDLINQAGSGTASVDDLISQASEETMSLDELISQAETEQPKGEGSLFEAIVEGPAAGALDFAESIGYIGKVMGIEGSNWLVETAQKYRPTPSGEENVMESTVREGLASTVNSVLSGIPGAALGAVSSGPVGAFPGYVASASTIMSVAEYGRFMDELVKGAEQSGMDLEDIDVLKGEMRGKAFISAIAEGGFEAAGNLALGKVVGFMGARPIEQGVKTAFKDILLTKAKQLGLVSAAEVSSELATTVVQHKAREATDVIPVGDLSDELFQTARVSGFQSLLMWSGAGAVHNGIRVHEYRQAVKGKDLTERVANSKEHEKASNQLIAAEKSLEKLQEGTDEYAEAESKKIAIEEELKSIEAKLTEESKAESPRLSARSIIAKLEGREDGLELVDEDIQNKILKRRIATETLNFALRGHPQAQLLEQGMSSAIYLSGALDDVDIKIIDDIKKLSRKGNIKGKKGELALRKAVEIVRGKNNHAKHKLKTEDPYLYEAAVKTKDYWNTKLDDVKAYKLVMAWKTLDKKSMKAITDIQNNIDVETAIKDSGADPTDVLDYIEQIEEIDNFGLEDYISHAELGTYRILDKEGNTIIIAQTPKQARKKVLQYYKDNPDASRTLRLDSSYHGGQEALSASRSGYWSVVKGIEESAKKNAEELQKSLNTKDVQKALRGVITIKPKGKSVGFLKQRKGVLKGEDNLVDLLYVYSKMINKKITLDPAILDLKNNLHLFEKPVQDALINQAEAAKGRYHWQDAFVDNIFSSFKSTENMKPFALSRFLGRGRGIEANLKLGYRPVAALVNYMGGMGHSYVQFGMKYIKKASNFIKTEEGIKFLQDEEHNLAVKFAVDIGGNPIASQEGVKGKIKPLYLFTAAELPTRKIGIASAYLYAKEVEGMDDEAARVFAREAVRFNLFAYNIASMPKIWQSPVGRTLFQFKTYLLQEMQFISQLRGMRAMRYMGFQLMMAGPRGYIYMLRSLPFFIAAGILDDWEEWMNKPHPEIPVVGNGMPTASRGIMGILGGDMTAQALVQLPHRTEDLFGPLLSDALGLYNKVLQPFMEGIDVDISDFSNWVTSIAPMMYYMDMLIDSTVDPEGWVKNSRGEKTYKIQNNWERLLLASSITPIKKSQADTAMRIINREEEIKRKNSAKATKRFAERILSNRPPTEDMYDDIIRYDIGRDAIRQAMFRRIADPKINAIRKIKLQRRFDAWERMNLR